MGYIMEPPIKHIEHYTTPPEMVGVYHYRDGVSVARCKYTATNRIYISNVFVYTPMRGKGYGCRMVKRIRESFPSAHIWVEVTESSRPFWVKMNAEGYIDEIKN